MGAGATAISLSTPAIILASTRVAVEFWSLHDGSGSMYSYSTDMNPRQGFNSDKTLLHYEIQRDGHIAAFLDENVQAALMAQPTLVHVAMWGGSNSFLKLTPEQGVLVRSEKDAAAIADFIRTRTPTGPLIDSQTHHFAAISRVLEHPRADPYSELILDISTDAGLTGGTFEKMAAAREGISAIGGKINVFAVDMAGKEVELNSLRKYVSTGFLKEGT
tara:strand:- start:590 stop:1243 length:654 start_codon:yes stop_codon:yes gene_type:complete